MIEEKSKACINKAIREMDAPQRLQLAKDSSGSTQSSPGLPRPPSQTGATETKTRPQDEPGGTAKGSKARHVKGKILFEKSSMERRNVDKHLVRYTLLNHGKFRAEVLDEYKRLNLDETKYEHSGKLLASLRNEEKSKEGLKMKRDYANIVSIMLSNEYLKAILKICLQHSLEDLKEKRSRRVKEQNRTIYITAIQDYLNSLTNN